MEEIDKKYNIWLPLALSVMMAIGMTLGYTMNEKDENPLIQKINKSIDEPAFGQVEELIRFVESRYVDSIDRNELIEAGISEILTRLDPHSIYISPDELERINNDMNGSFKGIGIEIFYIEDTVNVMRVIPDGPADLGGMKSFDKIISIDGEIVAGVDSISYDDIREKLKGITDNQELAIKVKRLNQDELISLNIATGDIPIHSIDAAMMLDEENGYIKINKFSSHTYRDFMEKYEEFYENGMKNLIIDLRGNPGGYLPEATNILSQLFREKDRMLVYTEGKNDNVQEYESTGKPFFQLNDIAVLIDENSASGSEIIAGAIQDWDRGIIIGRRSFGKGLVQEQYALSNGGAIRLTVARYYTPSGRSIQRSYDDYDHYYDDFLDRYESGELFHKDTAEQSERKIFRTKVLNRPVYGGGGITPDVFVAADSVYYQSAFAEIMQRIPQEVYLASAKYNGDKNRIASETLNRLSEAFEISQEYRPEINHEVMAEVIKQSEGIEAAQEYRNKTDKEINLALDYFNDKITLETPMAKNE